LGGSSESKSRATGTLSAPATTGWIQEDKHNAQNYCYRRRARLPHLGEPARVRDPGGQWRRQKRRTVRQEEKEDGEEGREEVSARRRPLRQEKEKDRKEGREEVRPRNDRPLRQGEKGREEVGARHRSLREEKEKDRQEGREEVRNSLSHRGLIAISNLEFLHKRPDMTSGRFLSGAQA